MADLQALVRWAEGIGVQLDGIEPARLPGRGVGIVATNKLEEGDVILVIPKRAIHSLHSLPPDIAEKLPLDMPIHGLLATHLALGGIPLPWQKLLPKYEDFQSSVPFMWPVELQQLLPYSARNLLRKQEERFESHWKMASAAFPQIRRQDFAHAWFLVNSRTFLYETPETMLYPWEDRLALLPVADLFNHSEAGCGVSFTTEWYSVTADRTYEVGEEVFISYGDHSNDYLLAEYGFTLDQNKWDTACLDGYIISQLEEDQKGALSEERLPGGCTVSIEPKSDRARDHMDAMMVALDAACAEGRAGEAHSSSSAIRLLDDSLHGLLKDARLTVSDVRKCPNSNESQRKVLAGRWEQIMGIVEKNLQIGQGGR